jgi:DNA-directed RNA polymerase specialized sigma24 family protein
MSGRSRLARTRHPPPPPRRPATTACSPGWRAATALQRLPPRERIALILRYVHDLSDEEIAAALQCRRGTVGSLLSRGREHLRQTPEIESLSTPVIAWSPPHG